MYPGGGGGERGVGGKGPRGQKNVGHEREGRDHGSLVL